MAYKILALFILVGHTYPLTNFCFAEEEANVAKFEIKKFRFSRNKRRNFERLVIQFTPKGVVGSGPGVKVLPQNGGKEASIQVEPALLVGAIPEAMINDSYITKSEFLGPISISTDGPSTGFFIRTFLKEAVNVEAFWLKKPYRLVLDVFPANSPRVEGPEFNKAGRGIASSEEQTSGKRPRRNPNGIICFPVSAQVSAALAFHPTGINGYNVRDLESERNGPGPGASEAVTCYLESSRVEPSVTYKPKGKDLPNYFQSGGGFGGGLGSGFGAGGGGFTPIVPGGAPKTSSAIPGAKPGSLLPDIAPGTTPLGSQLPSPSSVKSGQSILSPKLSTFGNTAPAGGFAAPVQNRAPTNAAVGLMPPLK